jgi:hypothetical protein
MLFRLLKRRRAIKSFVYDLPLKLERRFGQKTYFSLKEVDALFATGKYDKTFSAYAYALFCSRKDFDSYFQELNVRCTYDGLRKFVSKKYFNGVIDFNASSLFRFAKGIGRGSYDENEVAGEVGVDSSGHH